MYEELRAALERQALPLSQRVLDQMYENPWWAERYGDRGRRHANEDSVFHITYLQQALAADAPVVFTKYALWLRSVLVSRGMCSEHLAENYHLLAAAIHDAVLPDADAATRILHAGASALEYATGDAAPLEQSREALRQHVSAVAGEAREDDIRYLVSYLMDAVETGSFEGYEAFARRFAPEVRARLEAAAAELGVRISRDRQPPDAASRRP